MREIGVLIRAPADRADGYASQCCDASDPNSFTAWLKTRPQELTSTLEDMIVGGLRAVGDVDVPSPSRGHTQPVREP